MQRSAEGRLLVVCDACILINFLLVGRLDLLAQNPEFQCVVTEHVIAEITDPAQAAALAGAIEQQQAIISEVTEPKALVTFAELRRVLGSGESAALAAAIHRDLAIATDDGQTRREAERRLGPGRLLTTPGILLQAIRRSVLTVEQADEIKAELEKNRFKMSFKSFADLV